MFTCFFTHKTYSVLEYSVCTFGNISGKFAHFFAQISNRKKSLFLAFFSFQIFSNYSSSGTAQNIKKILAHIIFSILYIKTPQQHHLNDSQRRRWWNKKNVYCVSAARRILNFYTWIKINCISLRWTLATVTLLIIPTRRVVVKVKKDRVLKKVNFFLNYLKKLIKVQVLKFFFPFFFTTAVAYFL